MSWKTYENAAEKGPGCFLILVCGTILALSVLFSVVGGCVYYGIGWFSEAGSCVEPVNTGEWIDRLLEHGD